MQSKERLPQLRNMKSKPNGSAAESSLRVRVVARRKAEKVGKSAQTPAPPDEVTTTFKFLDKARSGQVRHELDGTV